MPRPDTPVPVTARLRFQVVNYNDDPACISVSITGVNTAGWRLSIDGLRLLATVDSGGNGRVCGLGNRQEVTLSILNSGGRVVSGGGGVPARGGAIMLGEWR